MTNFFGINITDNKRNTDIDGNIFVTNTITAEQNAEIVQLIDTDKYFEKKRELPLFFWVLRSVCQAVWMVISMAIIKAWGEGTGFVQGYKNAPELYFAGLISFIVWLALFCIGKIRKNKAENTINFKQYIETADTLLYNVRQSLEIPDDADSIDVFAERYIIKNNEIKHKNFGMTAFDNIQMFVFVRDGNLCLADTGALWEIPLSSLRSITLIKKRRNFPEWNKSEPIISEKYKPYRITTNQFGHHFVRYYRVEIIDIRGEFYMLIPEYDGKLFMELTKLRSTDNLIS